MTERPTLTQAERDQLVTDNLTFARNLAAKTRREVSTDLDLDDLDAWGRAGLVEAASRFDPTRGAAFTTFAYYRIRGAIYDGLRRGGWLSRGAYQRYAAAANELLQNAAERDVPENAASTEEQLGEVANTVDQLATIFITSLDAMERPDAADPDAPNAEAILERRQLATAVSQAIKLLPERERELLEAYYYEDITLEAAGQRFGLSKSWTSRLHARAIKLLTEALGPSTKQDG